LPWVRALEEAIGAAKAAIVLLGPSGFGNTQQYERELTFVRQTRDPTFLVVPVLLPDTRDPPFNFLRVVTWVDFSNVANISDAPDQLHRLLTAIQTRSEGAEIARQDICPYRGLDAFREEDSAFFFGRGSANDPGSPIGQLVAKVRDYGFVMVVGRSGSGKSSLVYAGLLPALRREASRFWNVLTLRPGPEPLRALAAAFNPRTETEGAAAYADKIGTEAEKLRTGDLSLLSHMIREELYESQGMPDRLLLYIDQWEELYAQALSPDDPSRAAQHAADVNRFIDLLLSATQSAPVTVVGTIRADFYDPLISHSNIRSLLPNQQVLLGGMTRSELESTIVEPAQLVGLTFDPPTLVRRILDDAGADEGMLPLLQYALKETWVQREGNQLTGGSYTRAGGVREAIRVTAERTFEALSPADQHAARQLFLSLVTPGEGQEDTRARAAMPTGADQVRIVGQFASPRTRLLVTGFNRARQPTVEVAHEALIRTWPRLRAWVDTNRDKLRSRAAVLQAKAEWEQNGRRDDMLLPAGLQLERARSLLTDPGDITTDDIKEFVSLSSTREEVARKQREDSLARDEARVAQIKASQERSRRAVAAVGAIILIAAATVGYLQWDKARQLASNEIELDNARSRVSAEQASNIRLQDSLYRQQVDVDHAQANFLGQLSGTKLLSGELDSALRLAAYGARLDFALPAGAFSASTATAVLAAAISQTSWRFPLSGHGARVLSATFSPNGSRIVTASEDKTARIWDAVTGKELAILRGHDGSVSSAAFSPNGLRVVTASGDKTARVWDAVTGKEIAVLRGHDSQVYSAAFSPDGSRVVTASSDKTARIWDPATGNGIVVLRGHTRGVSSAVFSPDGSRIVTASDDKSARIWDAASGNKIAVLGSGGTSVLSAAFSPDGSRIVTASGDTARIWDTTTAMEMTILRGHGGLVDSAAFSPDGSRIVTASTDQTARIWDAASGNEIAVLRGHDISVSSAAFSPDGLRIVTASGKTARIWDAAIGKEIKVLRGHDGAVRSAAFNSDGSRIVTGSYDQTARIWDAATGVEMAVLRSHDISVSSAAFSPDGSRIVTASSDKTARIWDAASGNEIAVLRGHDGIVRTAGFSPDGSRIVTASSDQTARIWDAATGNEIAVLRGHDISVYSAAFSLDGSRIVTASYDYMARIWDAATGNEIAVVRGRGGQLLSATFSPDGSRIVTASTDQTARIWDAASGNEIARCSMNFSNFE
jgi:WD40 repeat protein